MHFRITGKVLLTAFLALPLQLLAADAPAPPLSADYRLHAGDMLQISVWKEPDLQQEVLIRPDGGITFPLVGEMPAAGHTVAELTTTLEERIRKYVPDAVVTVVVKTVGGSLVFVVGKVNHPGTFPLAGPLDVMQAISLAGGSTPFADLNAIKILRRNDGHETAIPFKYGQVQHGRHLEQNILLQSGDTVVVP
jgi:polysaccharide export outer membrane protein